MYINVYQCISMYINVYQCISYIRIYFFGGQPFNIQLKHRGSESGTHIRYTSKVIGFCTSTPGFITMSKQDAFSHIISTIHRYE